MNASQIYIGFVIITLAAIMILLFVFGKSREKRLTPLAGLAFGFVLAGMFFSEERWIGYGLLGVGIILGVIDMVMQAKRKRQGTPPRFY